MPGGMGGGIGLDPAFFPTTGSNGLTPAQAATGLGTLKGQVAGATETGFLSSLPPSLQGLLSGSSTGTSGSTGTTGTTGTTGSAGASGSAASGTGGAAPNIAAPTMPDPTAANAATFANAKNQVGQTSRASLDALNGELGSQGMLGGGAAVQGARDVVNAGQTELGNVTNQQAITNAQTANQFAQTAYQGAITQRGQDIQQQEAASNLALQQNNAAFQQSYLRQQQLQNMLQMALSGINSPSASNTVPGLAPLAPSTGTS